MSGSETNYNMTMRIIAKRTLREFWQIYPDAQQPLQTWYQTVEKADWETPLDVKAYYGSASILANNWVCFNISGNKYRLITKIEYQFCIVYVRFIGTHTEYNTIDATKV